MWDWIDQNKSWLFEGGGVAALGVVLTAIWRKLKRKKAKPSAVPIEVRVLSMASPALQQPHLSTPLRQLPAPEPSKTTCREIAEKIAAAPLMMQKTIGDAYAGLVVEWQTTFQNFITSSTGQTRLLLVVLSEGKGYVYQSVWCDIVLEEHPQMKLFHEGHPIKVLGRITKAERGCIEMAALRLGYDVAVKELPKALSKDLPGGTARSKSETATSKGRRRTSSRSRK